MRAELEEAQRRRSVFVQGRDPIPVEDKIAIVVDDGLATGLTMCAAVRAIRKRKPRAVVAAVPVAAAESFARLQYEVYDLVALHIPRGWFGAIGAFYQYFDQVSDEEVIALLKSSVPAQKGPV
jgi:putative phosphoribosyl transferase